MVKNDLFVTVPSFFRCPISLDVMKSPVSLCTGVTYDRASIQRWLDSGNNTCPATMQVLHSKDLIPNHTLRRLIQIWSDSLVTRPSDSAPSPPPPPTKSLHQLNNSVTPHRARDLVQEIVKCASSSSLYRDEQRVYVDCLEKISKIICFAKESNENCKELLSVVEFLPSVLTILGKNLALSKNHDIAGLVCKAIQLSVMLLEQCRNKESIISRINLGVDFSSSMLSSMRQGNTELRIAAAKLFELIVCLNVKDGFRIAQNVETYSELLRLVISSGYDPQAMEASFSCLISLSTPRRNRAMLAKTNAVEVLTKALSNKDSSMPVSLTEMVLKLLEMVSSCKEGRAKICESDDCVEAIVKKVLKVSNVATEHGVTILWSLCCLFRDQRAQKGVVKSNGVAKVLLLMQSNCSPAVRQMCCDLLKVFRVVGSASKNYSCLSSYDTKTTHIMPF